MNFLPLSIFPLAKGLTFWEKMFKMDFFDIFLKNYFLVFFLKFWEIFLGIAHIQAYRGPKQGKPDTTLVKGTGYLAEKYRLPLSLSTEDGNPG